MKKTITFTLMMFALLTALFFAHAEVAQTPVDEVTAKSVALAHAALTEDDVIGLKVEWGWEDGREVFEVEFWKDATEYDYDIDATTGEIVSFDVESKGAALPQLSEATITPESALKTALEKAGVAEADANIVETSLKFKNTVAKYKIEFTSRGKEYEVEVDAANGAILEYDVETDDD